MQATDRPSIVLVHGAWADGSSWSRVIGSLDCIGHHVIAAPIPLTSLTDDVAALDRAIARTPGPVVLVAHAYAGAVISGSMSARVRALVFIAALAPDEGETVADVFYREKPHHNAPQLAPDSDGLIWMPDDGFASAFAQNASGDQSALFAATQRPIALKCIQQPCPKPAWASKPSWFLIAEEDRMISPATQHFMAMRMGAKIRSEKVDHMPLVTAPSVVVETIREAADAAVPGVEPDVRVPGGDTVAVVQQVGWESFKDDPGWLLTMPRPNGLPLFPTRSSRSSSPFWCSS